MKSFKKIMSVMLAMVILLSVMPVISFSAATALSLNKEFDVWATVDETLEYTYKPSTSGYYRLMSWGDDDPYAYCLDSSGNVVAESDDCGAYNYNFNCIAYLTKGKTYTYVVGAYSETTSTHMYFEKFNIDSSTVIEEDNSYDVALSSVGSKPALFKFVPQTAGYYGFYSVDGNDPFAYLYDSKLNLIWSADDNAYGYDFYLDWYLEAGETYYYEVASYYRGDYENCKVAIEKTEVIEELEIVKLPDDITVNEDYIAETIKLDGLVLKFNYSDGTVQEWSYDEDPVPENSNLKYDWYYDDEMNPYIEITTTFAYDYYYLEVVENKIESISIDSAPEIVLYEGYDGYYDEFLDMTEYYYSIPFDVNISINYNDGTNDVIPYYEGGFDSYDTQYDEPWGFGENYVYITYLGYETALPVQVKENPVESVTLNSAPTALYAIADPIYGFVDEEEGSFYLFPYNLEGVSVTVNFKDGTEKTYDNSDIDYELLTIGGLPFNVEGINAYGEGMYETVLNILGSTVQYEVKIIPEILLGDVDGDKAVTIMDSTALQRYSAKMLTLTDEQFYIGDADKDNAISVMDATRIQRYIAKIISDDVFFYKVFF